MYTVYILFSEKLNKYYKGQTQNLKDRLYRHNAGQERYTKTGVPWKLIFFTTKPTLSEAMILEKNM